MLSLLLSVLKSLLTPTLEVAIVCLWKTNCALQIPIRKFYSTQSLGSYCKIFCCDTFIFSLCDQPEIKTTSRDIVHINKHIEIVTSLVSKYNNYTIRILETL